MSREHKDPFMELLEAFFEGKAKSNEEPELPPTQTKGFKSLVTTPEFEAIMKVKNAMEDYIEVHNKCVIEHLRNRDGLDDSYASIQYLLLNDMVEDAMKAIGAMYGIHTLDKDVIDEAVKDCNTTLREFEKKLVFEAMMKKLKG